MATLAKQEKAQQSGRVKAGLDRVKCKGVILGRPAIEVTLAQQIKELVSAGLTDRAIGRKLNIFHWSVAKYKQ